MALRALRFALCVGVSASATCLDGGIPFGERKKLENANGESYPIGIWIPDWAASYAANILVATIVEEVFGFHTLEGAGSGTVSGFYAISGCRRPNEIGDLNARGCTDEVSKYHIGMETWTKSYPLVWEQLQTERGSMAARNLGNMGYEGVTGGFIPKPVQQEAYVKEGIALQYFRFWNASWYAPSQYFDPISMINATDMLKPCSSTASIFTEDGTMKSYVELSGDVDGVVIADDGTYSGKCADGYWWMSPSCRHNASLCVPFVTGGVGWDAKQYMQKSAKWNMPVALGVAASWGKYTSYPHTHPKSYFYWWIPDPTFLELQPLQVIYPPHDRIAYSQGDQSSAASAISIDKLVSRDLSILAPNVESFVKNVMVSIEQMNDMLLDQKNTSDTWRNTTCRWLRSHADVWRSWIPDESQCFPGFGLYDTVLETFTDHRVNVSNKISCQACPSGTFSQPLTDSTGDTYICVHCPKGTSQALGAAQLCRPCKSGEYQDEVGSRTCKRCAIGSYQDEQGAEVCKACPETTTTLGLGSVGASDCGCPADHIDVDESGGVQCQACSEGLTCPILSNLADLHRGESDLGDGYVPQVQKGFYSTKLSPTEVYRCRSEAPCPGGAPGTCAGGLVDTPCAQCHEGSTWTGSDCADCAGWRQVLWGMFIVGIFVFLLALYYLTSNKVTAKATVLFATTASVGLLVMSMQNLGLIGMMTIDWPESLKGIFGVCQFLLLDIDSYGFSCIAGSNPTIRYLLSVLIFPVGVLWLTGCFCTSKLLPAKYHWNGSKVCSTIGAFMQMSFSTMSAASLAPMMCYKHPNGLRSVLKYPDVICGSEEHTLMLVIGWCMLCTCVLGFVALCTYAVVRAPHWSVRRRDAFVAAVRFLVFRFRLDAWWFGVPLLVRGPLLSLPVVLATDYPPVQIVSIAMILSSFLVGQMIFWPWKVPMLNLSDCIVSFCVTLLVTTASLHLKIVDGPMIVFAEAVSTSMLSGIFAALGIMVLMTSSALIYRSALGGKQELRIFNLGPVTNSKRLAMKVKAMASKLEVMEMDDLSARLAALAVFDMNKVTTCITLLATEVAPPEEGAVTYKFNPRINSSSFDPSLAKPKRSKRSTMSSNSVAVKDENEANEKQDGNQDVTEATNRQPCEPIESAWM